jgi:hypothetical protein
MPAPSKLPPPAARSAPLTAPPLTDLTKPWCVARFTHSDGKPWTFYSSINEMTGDRLTAFNHLGPEIGHSEGEVRRILRNILKKATDVEIVGTIKPAT